jgi:annexin A7/11
MLFLTLNGGKLSDNSPLVQVFAGRTEAEIAPIRQAFHDIKRDNLDTKIKAKLAGDFEYAILAIAAEPAVFDARTIRKATAGMGTNEVTCIEILCTRTPEEIAAINVEYKNTDSKSEELLGLMNKETSGKLREMFRGILGERKTFNSAEVDDHVAALYRAGEGKIGTDSQPFIDIICGYEREHVEAVADAYEKTHGKPLTKVIESEFPRFQKKLLYALTQKKHIFFAEKLQEAFNKTNVDETTITRIIVSQREHRLTEISAHLNNTGKPKDRKPLAQYCTEKTSGNLKMFLNAICANFVRSERS